MPLGEQWLKHMMKQPYASLLGDIDTGIVEPGLLSNLAFKVTDVGLSEKIYSIATDRLIEKPI